MSSSTKIKEYLDRENVSFEALEHSLAYTAMEVAGSKHIPGKQMAKTVIVKIDGQFIMCVLPATHNIDFDKLKAVCGAKEVQLAKEKEIAQLFPGYDIGAEPPFGNLFGLKVIVDKNLEENQIIAFNAGTHTDLCKVKYKDFLRLVNPTVADIGTHI